MSASFIVAARRSPVAPRGGALAGFEPHALAAPVIAAALADAGLGAEEVGELVLADALGAGGNPARVAALAAGLPARVAGLSLDRQCAGGLDAIGLADVLIRAGQHDVVIAGGAESYSRRPLRLRTHPDGRPPEPYEQARFTPWPSRDPDMAEAADRLGRELGIGRAAQDAWAVASHARARAMDPDRRAAQIVPMGELDRDAFTRDLTLRLCARAPRIGGSITAANMAVAADGAAFAVVVSERVAARLGRAAVRIAGTSTLGGDPELPGLAPVATIAALLGRHRLAPAQLTRAEIMEAFAVQAIACQQGAGLPPGIVNPDGGALARGHPIGASGAVLAVSIYHGLRQQPAGNQVYGIAAIAAAGGIGTAMLLERV